MALYNRKQKSLVVKVLLAAAELKRKFLSAEKKRQIVRDQNTLLKILENKLEKERRQT